MGHVMTAMTDEAYEFVELIDLASGNVLGDFDDLASALRKLREVSGMHGMEAVRRLAVWHIRGDEESLVAAEDDLVAMVVKAESPKTQALQPSVG